MEKMIAKKIVVVGIILIFLGAGVTSGLKSQISQPNEKQMNTKGERTTQTFNPIDDTFVDWYTPNTPQGAATYLIVRPIQGGGTYEISTLIKFDLSSITAGITILSATLKLYYYHYNDQNPSGRTLPLYRITSNWNEETATYNNRPTYNPTSISSTTVPGAYGWMSWSLTSAVQDIVNGAVTNYGWQLKDPGSGNPMIYFYSKEYSNPTYYPYLEVVVNNPPYTPSAPSPADGVSDVPINADLSWTGGDPDTGDTVTYDVYFGTTSPPPLVATGLSTPTYDPGTLNYGTTYYWKIIALDNHGASTAGPIWLFTTQTGVYILSPIDDTCIDATQPTTPLGALYCMIVRPPASAELTSLVKFDLSSIPSGTTITSATLKLYYFHWNDVNPSGRSLALHQITSTWNEETVTLNTRPTYNTAVLSSSTVPGSYSWMNWDLTSAVQDIINGATTNYGWQLMDHGTSNPMIYFYTKEHSDPTYYPVLEVDVTPIEDQTPPVTDIVLGNPHTIEDDGSTWLTSDTSFTLVASDDQAIPDLTSYTGVQTTIYRIDNEVDQVYTGPFNLTGYPPEIPHQISYWSIDFAGNIEEPKYYPAYPSLFMDDSPPELQGGTVEPGDPGMFGFQVGYSDPNLAGPDRDFIPFDTPLKVQIPGINDGHPRTVVDYEGNTHFVWMSKDAFLPDKWEIHYTQIDPDGLGGGNKVLVDQTVISDDNTADSMYPSLVLEDHEDVFLNDTIYQDKYAVLVAPVRYFIDQEQHQYTNKVAVTKITDPNLRWQQFSPTKKLGGQSNDLTWWIDVLIYKNPSIQYTHKLNLSVHPKLPNGYPNLNVVLFSCQYTPDEILDGYQWLAFHGIFGPTNLVPNGVYCIVVESEDPYEWCYSTTNPYSRGISSQGGSDFAFIERYEHPEIRFKHQLSLMRNYLLGAGYTDNTIYAYTIPYNIDTYKWRIPRGYMDTTRTVFWEWQPISYDFAGESTWIDGGATHDNLAAVLTQLRTTADNQDLVYLELINHGDGGSGGGCANGYRPVGTDPRVAHDELDDGTDDCFCTYDSPNEGWDDTNYWYDDELDIALDQIMYKHMVVVVGTCHSGGFIPDLNGPRRIVLTSAREDELSYSYMYRFWERIDITQSPAADTNGDGWVSVREAHFYAVQQHPIEYFSIKEHHQIDIWDTLHVVWADQRNGNWEIYYSKLGSVVDYSAANNGVDLTTPDSALSALDTKDSGRVVTDPAQFIEHPDIAIDSDHNLHIVWSDNRNTNWQIYYQKQDNSTPPTVLIDDTRISGTTGNAECPAIAIGPAPYENVHIVWQDNTRNGIWDIMYQSQSTDGTVIYDDMRETENDGYPSTVPDIAVDGSGVPRVTFMDARANDPGHMYQGTHKPGYWEVYTIRIGNYGYAYDEKRQSDMNNPAKAWGDYTGPTPDGYSLYPRIAVSGDAVNGDIFLTWYDNRTGNFEIFYSEISTYCSNPNTDIQVSNDNGNDMFPDIALDRNNNPDINWMSDRSGDWDIFGARWSGSQFLTVEIDGVYHHMFPVLPHVPLRQGTTYIYGRPLGPGDHTYSFHTNNGLLETQTLENIYWVPGEGIPDPDQSFVTLTNESGPNLITCPAGDGPSYNYVKVTCRTLEGYPISGIPCVSFVFTVNPTGGDTHWYGQNLYFIFTPYDYWTDINGEIRFLLTAPYTSIYGNITIQATVMDIPLNDIDTLWCKTPDYDTNGAVSLGDFVLFASDYSKVRWRSDFTGDGLVSLGDFVLFARHYAHSHQ